MTVFKRVELLLELAVQAWNKKEYNRAQYIYLRAVLGLESDSGEFRETLSSAVAVPQELKLIRNTILQELRTLEEQGETFSTWMELANAVAPIDFEVKD